MPSAVSETGPSVFFRRRSECSESAINLSMDLQQKIWCWELRLVPAVGSAKRLMSPGVLASLLEEAGPPFTVQKGGTSKCHIAYRFACPRAIFFTFDFFDPRAYSRGLTGCSSFRFFRAARFAFLRSSLLNAVVLAMKSYLAIL